MNHNERSGLLMVASSLLVIFVITGLVFRFQREQRREQTRVQGVSLARLLSNMPFEQLVGSESGQGPFDVMKRSQGNPDFAYGALMDPHGGSFVEVAMPGVFVPATESGAEPSSWTGERTFTLPGDGRQVREFFAPVLSDGQLVAHVRVGFLEPALGISFAELPSFAMMALAIFLLAPLSYFLLRRELRPFATANRQIQRLIEGQQLGQVRIEASGELGEFARRFNSLLRLAEQRVERLQSQQVNLIASSKVLSYKKTRLESVLETLPDAAVVMDEAGVVGFANAKLEAVFGVKPDAALGQPCDAWCPESGVRAFLAPYVNGASRVRSDTMELARDDGRVLWVGAYPLATSAPGEKSGTLVLIRDTTSQALARQAQAEFVTHVAHELKSPLNVFAMYTEMLLGKDGESEAFRIEACNVLQDEVERLSALIQTLLSIARLETGAVSLDRQRVRLPEFLRDVLESVSRSGRRAGLRFDLHLSQELHPIGVDKDLLRVALNNLLTNAIKYNREGGEVVLAAEEDSDQVRIKVTDTGIGIADEERARIFDKFYRSEREEARQRGGHGLGLALVREIIERHGGSIQLESQIGQGSEFTLVFPKSAVQFKETI